MIPKILHACWFGGNEMSEEVKGYLASWKKYNPDYEIKIWNEKNFDLTQNLYALQAYKAQKYAFVTDYVRLKVLNDYGGIYMDTDVEVIKSLDFFLKYPAFSGFQRYGEIPTGTMGAERGNKWISLLLKYYDDRQFVMDSGEYDLTTNVTSITDITVESYGIVLNNDYQEFEDFVMFPSDYLCAKSLEDGSINITSNTYTIHHFAGSWLGGRQRLNRWIIKHFGYKTLKKLSKVKQFMKSIVG